MTLPLEPDHDERARLNDAVLDYVTRFVESRATRPVVAPPEDPQLVGELLQAPAEHGQPIDALLTTLDRALNTGFDTASGKMLSYIPSGALYSSALGSFVAAVTNRFTGASHAGVGPVAIEQGVIDWMLRLFGLPDDAVGVLLSGGSIANLTAMVAARTKLGDDFGDGVVYTSDWSHHSVEKAARIAGITRQRIRKIPTDAQIRMSMPALAQALAEDQAAGLRPLMIAATAGVTDTGSIDPLQNIADFARRHGCWFHVDAAYGGFFQLTERGRERLSGIEQADSITVDAHKSLLLPFGIGGLLVRDRANLVLAHEGSGHYMRDVADGERPHFHQMSPELTRPFRGLAVWLPLQLHGVAAFRSTLDRMLDFAVHAAREIATLPTLTLVCQPELSIVVFRSKHGAEATLRLLDHINACGDAHLSSTVVDGQPALRLAFLSQRTDDTIVARVLQRLREAALAP